MNVVSVNDALFIKYLKDKKCRLFIFYPVVNEKKFMIKIIKIITFYQIIFEKKEQKMTNEIDRKSYCS